MEARERRQPSRTVEVLRAWLEGHGLRKVAERAGVDRKTARRYVAAAEAAGLAREAGGEAVTDELVGVVDDGRQHAIAALRPSGSPLFLLSRS